MNYFALLNLLGVIVFAISGVILAGKYKMDPIGVLVLATVTAVGGGTMRDIMLNNGPIFWFADPCDIYAACITAIIAMFCLKIPAKLPKKLLPILDAIGLAFFVGVGINKAIAAEANPFVVVSMGIMTGVGGGMIRDVLAREVPMIFQKDIYATACIIGGSTHFILYQYCDFSLQTAMNIGMLITLIIRLAAIQWSLRLPVFTLKNE